MSEATNMQEPKPQTTAPQDQNLFTGQFAPNPNYQYSLNQQEYAVINQLLQAFAMPLATVNMLKDRAVAEGGLFPIFKNDVDEKGQLRQEFLDKHFPKKDNSIIIDPKQN